MVNYLVIFIFALPLQGLSQYQVFDFPEGTFSEAIIYVDEEGNKYSNLFTFKFNQNIVSNPYGVTQVNFVNFPNHLSSLFDSINNKYQIDSLIKMYPGYIWGDTLSINVATGMSVVIKDNSQTLRLFTKIPVLIDSLVNVLTDLIEIEYAHGPMIFTSLSSPNDPLFLNNSQWNLLKIDAEKAWKINIGKAITVAINDVFGGNYATHEDLEGNVIISNGYKYGGHGLWVAGVVGAVTNNGLGIASLNWNAKLIFNSQGPLSFQEAINNGARIINCSWITYYANSPYFQFLLEQVYNTLAQGVVIVAGAGNSEGNPIGQPVAIYPAAFNFNDVGQVVAVSATQILPSDQLEHFAYTYNYSPGNDPINDPTNSFIDVCAPGINVWTTAENNQYGMVGGTSFATAITSSLVSAILSINQSLTPKQIYTILTNTADKINPNNAINYSYVNGWSRFMGYGRINLYNAVKYTLENFGGIITGNLVIPADETWTISEGTILTFEEGASLIIYGTLNAMGTENQKIEFDFTSPTSGNGIIVSPDAVINISNAVIKNAQFGISIDRVEPTIQDCEFMNCTYGIFLNESNYEISTYEGTRIINNKFTDNNSGITLDNSSPLITGNEFSGNSTSVQCLNNSNAYFGEYIEPGMNSFHDNLASDVYASYSSPTLGFDLGGGEYVGGYNSFENVQEYFVIAENSSIEAGLNWWGEAPPNENLFFTENGNIELRPWLENPLSSPQQQNTNNKFAVSSPTSVTLFDSTWSIRKKINHAYKLLTSDEKIAGRRILKDVVNDHPDSALSFRAMGLFIHSCNLRTEKDTLKKFLQLLVNHQNQKEIHRYAVLRLAEMKRETFLTNVNKLIAANPTSAIMDLLYYNKFNHYYFYEKNKSLAREVMDKMVEKFPLSLMTKTAKQLLEVHQSNKFVQNTITVNSEKEISISNFPNPFNPTTTINYTIPRSTDYQSVQKVTLKIYDVLGREVATLVNEELKAGSHTATFNASHLSSSVYFCTLKTDKHFSTIKLLLMK